MEQDYKSRLIDEIVDLKEKIEKLNSFIDSPEYMDLRVKEQCLLDSQIRAMLLYMDILVLRSEESGIDNVVAEIFRS